MNPAYFNGTPSLVICADYAAFFNCNAALIAVAADQLTTNGSATCASFVSGLSLGSPSLASGILPSTSLQKTGGIPYFSVGDANINVVLVLQAIWENGFATNGLSVLLRNDMNLASITGGVLP